MPRKTTTLRAILSHGELAASGSAGQLSQDGALLAASYLGGAAGDAPG